MDYINFQNSIIDLVQKYEKEKSQVELKEFRYTSICESLNHIFDDYKLSEMSMLTKLRTLSQTKITLSHYYNSQSGSEKLSICKYCLEYIEVEIDILKSYSANPSLAIETKIKGPQPLRWLGTMNDLMELICSLYYCGNIAENNGTRISFMRITRAFETLFNLQLKDPFKKRAQLAERKKSQTPFLDSMKRSFIDKMESIGL